MSAEGRMRQLTGISSGKSILPPSRLEFKTKLEILSTRVRRIKNAPLNNLACFIDKDWLEQSWQRLNKRSASGVDRISAEAYAENLSDNIDNLLHEMKLGSYKPLPLKRVYIPKANGKCRKLGLPSLKDKLAQQAVSMVLTEVYEQEFLPMSFGYRPGKTAHEALNAVKESIAKGKVSWVVDVDINSFFDEMSHKWLIKFLRHRIADKHLLRLINKWLKAGVMEEGKIQRVSTGTPQGGVISPLLANIYLHYVIDLWVTKVVPKYLRGKICSFRYADDMLFCFQNFNDALRFSHVLEQRLSKFGLRLNQAKSKLCRFGRFAEENRKRAGEQRRTIQFLGFTLYNKTSRKGKYTVGCRTASSRLNTAMNNIRNWCKEHRHQKIAWQARYLNAVLRGHYNYYGVTHNFASINAFYRHVQRMWQRYLSKRSQRAFIPWEKFYELQKLYPLEEPYLPKASCW